MTRLIEIEEIITVAEEMIEQAAYAPVSDKDDRPSLREWYDETLAEREARHNRIKLPDGSEIEVNKTYDITVMQPVYRRRNLDAPAEKKVTLRGWTLWGRVNWSDQYLNFRHGERGAFRELAPSRILSAVEVTR